MADSQSSVFSFLRRRTPWSRRSNANAVQDDEEFLLARSETNHIQDITSSTNKLYSDKTSLSGQTLDSQDDTGSDGGALSCGDGSPSIRYCRSCQIARAAPGYFERVARLMDCLYCTACECEHPAILFSQSSRQKPSSSRACIAHEGYLRVCPHLKLSLEDIRSLRTGGESIDLKCKEETCTCPGAIIQYFLLNDSPIFDFVAARWTAALDGPTSSSSFMDQCISKTRQRHALYSSSLCPAFQTTPDRLFQPDQFSDNSWPNEAPRLECMCDCGFTVYYDQERNMVDASYRFELPDTRDNIRPLKWIKMLDPSSYGHFEDSETKNITWCNDRYCITTRELVKHYASIKCFENRFSRFNLEETLEDLDKKVKGKIER